jgi:hypothetical protein
MARPRKATENKKTYRLIVWLNPEERKLVERAAKTVGLKAYSFGRLKILDGRIPKPVLSEIDLATYLELKKIGVNINQLARVGNSGRFPVGINMMLSKLSEHLEAITRLLLDDRHSENR